MSRRPTRPAAAPKRPNLSRNAVLGAAVAALFVAGAVWLTKDKPSPPPPAPVAAIPLPVPSPPTRSIAIAPPPAAESPMPEAVEAEFNGFIVRAFRACWNPPKAGGDGAADYLPRIRVTLKADGSLASAPRLVNPPSDPDLKVFADTALKAIKSCAPLRIPDAYQPYYTQWKTRTLFFDPT